MRPIKTYFKGAPFYNAFLASPEGPFFKRENASRNESEHTKNYGPITVHELLPILTQTFLVRHPCCVFSVSYSRNCRCHSRSQSRSIGSVPANALVLTEPINSETIVREHLV